MELSDELSEGFKTKRKKQRHCLSGQDRIVLVGVWCEKELKQKDTGQSLLKRKDKKGKRKGINE